MRMTRLLCRLRGVRVRSCHLSLTRVANLAYTWGGVSAIHVIATADPNDKDSRDVVFNVADNSVPAYPITPISA